MKLWKVLPLWGVGFCCVTLLGLFLAVVSLEKLGPTHAVGWGQLPEQTTGIRSVSTHQALKVDSKVVDVGNRSQDEEIDLQIRVDNIWTRALTVTVQLHNLPGWKAHVDQSRLLPGESTLVHVTSKAEAPGEVAGHLQITALDDFLSLRVAVRGQIAAKPPCPGPPPGAPEGEAIPEPSPQKGPPCQETGESAPAKGSGEPAASAETVPAANTGSGPVVMPEGDEKSSGANANLGDQELPALPATQSD